MNIYTTKYYQHITAYSNSCVFIPCNRMLAFRNLCFFVGINAKTDSVPMLNNVLISCNDSWLFKAGIGFSFFSDLLKLINSTVKCTNQKLYIWIYFSSIKINSQGIWYSGSTVFWTTIIQYINIACIIFSCSQNDFFARMQGVLILL